jgi:putative flippase GtrA
MTRFQSIKQWLYEDPKGKILFQFIKFGLVGVTNTAVAYGIYALILLLGGHYLLGSVISFLVSVAWSFLLNNRFVFRKEAGETRIWWKTLIKAYLSYGVTGILLANALLYLWIDVLGVNQYLAFFLNLIITIPTNFLLNKLWAFRKEPPSTPVKQDPAGAPDEKSE